MDKNQKAEARARLATVRAKLADANLWITEGDSTRAFQSAEEAYMAAFDAKEYLDQVMSRERDVAYRARQAPDG